MFVKKTTTDRIAGSKCQGHSRTDPVDCEGLPVLTKINPRAKKHTDLLKGREEINIDYLLMYLTKKKNKGRARTRTGVAGIKIRSDNRLHYTTQLVATKAYNT